MKTIHAQPVIESMHKSALLRYRVGTSHGNIAVAEIGKGETTVMFIHGNSSCAKVFEHQLLGPLSRSCRLVAFDLPGHGDSDDAIDPYRTYTRPGFAAAAIELSRLISVSNPIVVGWSLGGHIAIEMMATLQNLRGVMVCGSPPIGPGQAARGFTSAAHAGLGRKRFLSASERADFARGMAGEPTPSFLLDAIARCDGRSREILFKARDAGAGIDQRRMVESSGIPLAVVNGADDPFVNIDFFDEVAYANLWEARCHRLRGVGHAPFWSGPDLFAPFLERFVRDVQTSASVVRP